MGRIVDTGGGNSSPKGNLNRGGQKVVPGNTRGLIGGNKTAPKKSPGKVKAKPQVPPKSRVQVGKGLKIATKELFITEEKTMGEIAATERIFQEIAGVELLSIARNYSIDGATQAYNPISNIADLSNQYDPFNIIPLQGIDRSYFNQYDIDLSRRLPDFPNNPDGSSYNVYMDANNTIYIELADLLAGEKVEIEFLSSDDQVGWYNIL
jgi:hypothetical protein